MRIQVVLNQHDPGGFRKVDVAQVTQNIGMVDGGTSRGDLP